MGEKCLLGKYLQHRQNEPKGNVHSDDEAMKENLGRDCFAWNKKNHFAPKREGSGKPGLVLQIWRLYRETGIDSVLEWWGLKRKIYNTETVNVYIIFVVFGFP